MAADIDLAGIAKTCADCGNCLFACPVYNATLIEPNSPRGKVNLIKALMEGRLKSGKLNRQFISRCLLCGSCEYICTNGVEFVSMMIDYRNRLSGGRKIPLLKKFVLFSYQSLLFKKMGWLLGLLARTPLKRYVTIPRPNNIKLKHWLTEEGEKEYDILLFPGCVLTYFYSLLIAKIKVFLEGQGFSVALPRDLKCCGFPYLSQGWRQKFDSLREENRRIFSRFKFKYLVVPCGNGTMMFRDHYDIAADRVFELTEFIHRFCPEAEVQMAGHADAASKVTYHDPCHNLKTLGIEAEPRFFLSQLGQQFVDDPSASCCGFGGFFSIGFPKVSRRILERRQKALAETGAHTVITSCPGCYLHLRENLHQHVKFFIELF